MKNILKRGLPMVLALIMMVGLLPVTAFAAVDSSGRPKDVNNSLILSIYTGTGFPGEPAVYGTGNYMNINSSFAVRKGATFASSAKDQLDWDKIDRDIVQGSSSGSTSVWGVYDANGTKDYFLKDASIIDTDNEIKMICAVKGCSEEEAKNYQIVWYVIKLQHSSSWFGTTEWHIDGVIKERAKISINYYGNGNTSGNAPLGVTNHTSGAEYTILGKNDMLREINGVEVAFLGWSAKADGTGEEQGFYQPGAVIEPTQSISLYAMWDTTTQYTATVKTYLDTKLLDAEDIHDEHGRVLYLSTDQVHYYELTRVSEGVYTTNITGNGKFHVYTKHDGNYEPISNHQLTIYNQDATLELRHYSVSYNPNGGAFKTDPGKQVYPYGAAVTAIQNTPTRDGYRFLGWNTEPDGTGTMFQPNEEVTASITDTMVLYAQWEETVTVTVNVTINHRTEAENGGYDQTDEKGHVTLTLASKADATSPYLEIGETLKLTKDSHEGFQYSANETVTEYKSYTLKDMPGGDAEYTAVTSKPDYDTSVKHYKDGNGNWVVDIVMTYKPTNFDLEFDVVVDENVPDEYVPVAAIVKVIFWAKDRQRWEIITQQEGSEPGVRVDIDPESRKGSGSYPVWQFESDGVTPYGNGIRVTSFIYPDGTIVPASYFIKPDKTIVPADEFVTEDVQYTDKVYTAKIEVEGGKQYGKLYGAYYDVNTETQQGTLTAVITMDLYSVTFDAKGGKVNDQEIQIVEKQYEIPEFKGYVPTRDGGYIFDGWYLDEDYKYPAVEGTDLDATNTTNGNITLYAKWKEPLTISGTVTVAGTYKQNGEDVAVHDIDRATEAFVVLQEIRNGKAYDIDGMTVEFGSYEDTGRGEYRFTGIPNDGKQYQIHVLELNYNTTYENEGDTDEKFNANEYAAVFGDDNTAEVNAHLTFAPPSYEQKIAVDSSQIGEGFKPETVLSEILYRDTGDNHAYQRISQHDVEPYGVEIKMEDDYGEGSESVWNWHTDGTMYDYRMNVTEVDGVTYDSDSAPYSIAYGVFNDAEAVVTANNAATPNVILVAVLIPRKYPVTFNLNAGTDTVTGMDAYKKTVTDTDEAGNIITVDVYQTEHTWSFDTAITAVPEREGYTFLGWEANAEGVYDGSKIPAAVHQEVTLTAQWEKKTYTVTTAADPETGGETEGAGSYEHGTEVTVKATSNPGYAFNGWWENGKKVSEDAEYTFTITANRNLTAKFNLNKHTVVIEKSPAEGGTTTGAGAYNYGTEVTLVATANPGYTFVGWKENGTLISSVATWTIERLTEDREFVAAFKVNQYKVDVQADPENAGTVSGNGTYNYGQKATLTANENTGYKFVGWYKGEELVSSKLSFEVTVTENLSYVAKFEAIKYTVDTSASPEVGGTTGGDGKYEYGATVTVVATANKGYKFMGWFNKENGEKVSEEDSYSFTVTADCTLVAQFGAVEITEYTITTIAFPENAGTLTGGGTYMSTESATIRAEAKSGYCFIGWYDEDDKFITAEASYTLTVKGNRTFTAKFETEKTYRYDYVYLFGYNNSEIGAEGPLLRSEVAQMIYRLVRQNGEPKTTGQVFADTSGQWFQSGIAYMAQKGAIDSTKDKAYPYVAVTRGETYKMLCLGLGYTSDTSLRLSQYAAILENHGFNTPESSVSGTIKRYEFCELFNEILGRTGYSLEYEPGKEITPETYGYKDLSISDPYYQTMMIATSAFKEGKVDVKGRIDRNKFDYNR